MKKLSKDKIKLIVYAVLAGVAVAAAIYVGTTMTAKDKTGDNSTDTALTEQEMGELNNSSEKAAVALNGDEHKAIIDMLSNGFDAIANSALLINVQQGTEDWTTYITNKIGESFAQESSSGSVIVHRKDDQTITYGEYITFSMDGDIMELLSSVVDMAKSGDAVVLKSTEDYAGEGYETIVVDVQGIDNIRKIYSKLGDDYADSMVAQFKDIQKNVVESGEYEVTENDQMNFRFMFVADENGEWIVHVACYIYFGDIDPADVTYSDINLSWLIEGITAVYDWSLDEAWYTFDWSTLPEIEDTTEVENMLVSQFEKIETMLNQYQIDHGLNESASESEAEGTDMDDISGTEGTEGTEGHYHEDGTYHEGDH